MPVSHTHSTPNSAERHGVWTCRAANIKRGVADEEHARWARASVKTERKTAASLDQKHSGASQKPTCMNFKKRRPIQYEGYYEKIPVAVKHKGCCDVCLWHLLQVRWSKSQGSLLHFSLRFLLLYSDSYSFSLTCSEDLSVHWDTVLLHKATCPCLNLFCTPSLRSKKHSISISQLFLAKPTMKWKGISVCFAESKRVFSNNDMALAFPKRNILMLTSLRKYVLQYIVLKLTCCDATTPHACKAASLECGSNILKVYIAHSL